MDIPGRRIQLVVEDAEMRRREEAWRPPAPKVTQGALAEYALRVSSASRGAVRLRLDECREK
jgi:dihydroxy-acid dehydratase